MFKRRARKKELFKEIEELQKKLAFYILVSKVAQITIPEELVQKYGNGFHESPTEEDIKRWPDHEDIQFLHELYIQTRTNKQLLWIGYTKLDRKNRGIIYPSKGNRKCLVKSRNAQLIRKSSNANS